MRCILTEVPYNAMRCIVGYKATLSSLPNPKLDEWNGSANLLPVRIPSLSHRCRDQASKRCPQELGSGISITIHTTKGQMC